MEAESFVEEELLVELAPVGDPHFPLGGGVGVAGDGEVEVEGVAERVGEVFEFLFFFVLLRPAYGGGLRSVHGAEGVHALLERGGEGGEEFRGLIEPDGVVGGEVDVCQRFAVTCESVFEFSLHRGRKVRA